MGGGVAALLRRLVVAAEVDDLSQETFVRVLTASPRYRPSGKFTSWLFRIVINLARDAQRSSRSRPPSRRRPDLEIPSAAPAPDDVAAEDESRGILASALRRLPAEQREVVVLKHFGHLTFREIAEVVDAPPSTLKSRLAAALKQLARELRRLGVSTTSTD